MFPAVPMVVIWQSNSPPTRLLNTLPGRSKSPFFQVSVPALFTTEFSASNPPRTFMRALGSILSVGPERTELFTQFSVLPPRLVPIT